MAAAVLHKDGTFLGTQRGYGEFEGGWEFPGGKIEEGESPQAALLRELKAVSYTHLDVYKRQVYAKYFTSKPARSCVAVKTLPKGVLCEIEAIAVK